MIPLKLQNILKCLLHKKRNICTLCYTSTDTNENALYLSDIVVLKNGNEQSILYILNVIFDPDINKGFVSNIICQQCVTLAISSYLFIKKYKDNTANLLKVLQNIVNDLHSYLDENLESIKTIYLLTGNKHQSYFDTKCEIKCVRAAKMRLQCILSEELNVENLISMSVVPEEESEFFKQHKKKMRHDNASIDTMSERDELSKIKCKVCLKVFHTKTNFRQHYIRVHGPKTIKCPKCPKYFGSITILEQHKSESHLEAVCSHCGKTYNNKHYLKVHELSHRVKFKCSLCKRMYKTQETFNMHLILNICSQKQRKGSDEATFTCDICKKKFCHKASLKVHIMVQHSNSKAHICNWCNKRFSAQSRLNAHIVKHTKVKKFTCTICKSRFVTKTALTYHTRIHTGEKPYKCFNCEEAFISSSRRSAHMRKCHENL